MSETNESGGVTVNISCQPEPSAAFLYDLAMALKEAAHEKVAGHLAAGLLWAIYPRWADEHIKDTKHEW